MTIIYVMWICYFIYVEESKLHIWLEGFKDFILIEFKVVGKSSRRRVQNVDS